METLMADESFSGDSKMILVVDDQPEVRDVISVILNTYGYQTIEACDGCEARALYEANHIDLVITDIFMPKKDGFSLIEELKKDDPEAKIIAMSGGTGSDCPHCLNWATSLGVSGTFIKPFNHLNFMNTIKRVLEQSVDHQVKEQLTVQNRYIRQPGESAFHARERLSRN